MGERYVEDKKNNLIYLGDSSSAEGTFNDECLVYNTINKSFFMVEKYNNGKYNEGVFFKASGDSTRGELGLYRYGKVSRSHIEFENKDVFSYEFYSYPEVLGRFKVKIYWNGSFEITPVADFYKDIKLVYRNNAFYFKSEDRNEKLETFITKETDDYNFYPKEFFFTSFRPSFGLKYMDNTLDNRYSIIHGQNAIWNSMDGYCYERTYPKDVMKPDVGISRYIGEFMSRKRTGLGCFRDDIDNIYLGKWHQNKFYSLGAIDNKKCVIISKFDDGKSNGATLTITDAEVIIARYNHGTMLYPYYRFSKDGLVLEKINSSNNVVAKYNCPYSIYPKNVYQKQYETGLYIGEFSNNVREGHGVFYYKNGDKYVGRWEKDNIHGQGVMYFNSKYEVYKGSFRNNEIDGFGTYYFAENLFYHGFFSHNKPDNIGTTYIRGEVRNDNLHTRMNFSALVNPTSDNINNVSVNTSNNSTVVSKHTSNNNTQTTNVKEYKKETYSNGYYEGYFYNGKRNWQGTYHWTESKTYLKYVGEWKDGNYHGKGVMYYKDGSRYDGPWVNDKMHGQGIWFYPDGTSIIIVYDNGNIVSQRKNIQKIDYGNGYRYEGETKNGVCHGKGVYYWNNNTRYEGEFKDGKLHGNGIIYYPDGTSEVVRYENDNIVSKQFNIKKVTYSNGYYEGTFKHDERHGFGTYYYNDGNKYEGNYSNGKMEGKGTFTFKDGGKYTGSFVNGNFEGFGKYYYPDGSRYEGNWKNDKKYGQGTMYYPDGTKKTGLWNNHECVEDKPLISKEVKPVKNEKKTEVKVSLTQPTNSKVDINSIEFKEKMKEFAYKVTDEGDVVITSCKNPPKKLIIPEGVTIIYQKAFHNNKPQNIEEVVVANSVKKIQAHAFFGCKNLKKLTLGYSLVEIGKWAFINSPIKELYIPDNVKKIGEFAFNCLEDDFSGNASIPSTCKLDKKAFSDKYSVNIRK